MSNNKDLVKIIDLYEIRVDGNRKARLANLNVIGEISPGLPLAEDLIKQYLEDPWSLAGKSIICAARLSDQYGSPTYNRTEEIDLNKCEQNLEEKSGYSYQSANVGSGWVRPYGKEIANTQSGHRATMRYAVELDPDARTVLNLSFHNPNHSYDVMIQIESDDHHTDCADRKNQSGLDKFKSAYYGRRDWAVQLYDYCKPFDISIAGTLVGAYFSLPSHSYLSTALSLAGKGNVDTYLKSCEKLLKKNGLMFTATLNRTLTSYLKAIIGAEYILRWLPIGTHDWNKFIKPEELEKQLTDLNFNTVDISGLSFNPILSKWSRSNNLSVNYIICSSKN